MASNAPLESTQGRFVGPPVGVFSCGTPGQRPSATPRIGELAPQSASPDLAQATTGMPAFSVGTASMATAKRPADRAAAAAAALSAGPSTNPTKLKPAWRPFSISGFSACCCSASSGKPEAQLTTRQLTGVPCTKASKDGSCHWRSTSAISGVKFFPFCRLAMSKGPAGHRIGTDCAPIDIDLGLRFCFRNWVLKRI